MPLTPPTAGGGEDAHKDRKAFRECRRCGMRYTLTMLESAAIPLMENGACTPKCIRALAPGDDAAQPEPCPECGGSGRKT